MTEHTESIDYILARLDMIKVCMEDKGYRSFYTYNNFMSIKQDDGRISFSITYKIDLTDETPLYLHAYSIHDILAQVRNLPTAEEAKQLRWRQKLADLVIEGEALGFAMEYVEMLRETAKKLASNALPKPPVVQIDDEIPF